MPEKNHKGHGLDPYMQGYSAGVGGDERLNPFSDAASPEAFQEWESGYDQGEVDREDEYEAC